MLYHTIQYLQWQHSSRTYIIRQEDGPMELLKERIRREGKVLPGNIIKVDGFLNHRVEIGRAHV